MTVELPIDTIICGDCRDVTKDWPGGSVNAIVTDAPYGIDFKYDQHDDSPDLYCHMMKQFVTDANRLVGDGPVFVWQAMLNAPKWHQWFPAEFRLFAACKAFVQYRPTAVQYSWDPVIWWGQCPGEPSVYRKDYHEQRLAPFGQNRDRIAHPCPRPLEQVAYVVDLASVVGGIILDPFCGSGTTCVAAKMLGRHYVGIDISEDYCRISRERLAAVDTGVPIKEARAGQLALFGDKQ